MRLCISQAWVLCFCWSDWNVFELVVQWLCAVRKVDLVCSLSSSEVGRACEYVTLFCNAFTLTLDFRRVHCKHCVHINFVDWEKRFQDLNGMTCWEMFLYNGCFIAINSVCTGWSDILQVAVTSSWLYPFLSFFSYLCFPAGKRDLLHPSSHWCCA
jgi:hypothetical protein